MFGAESGYFGSLKIKNLLLFEVDMLVFWLSFLLPDLIPIATVLMHGLVWGRAMDLMLWKRGKKRCKKREFRGNGERNKIQKKKIRIVKKGK